MMGPMPLHLSRIRLAVQVVMLVVTVYGGAVVGHYLADKVSNALPALSCAYDQENAGYCVLIPLQHQLHHRVGESIVRFQQFSFDYLIPVGFTLLAFFGFFVVLNKAFCGWICPLGTLQEILYRIGRRLNLPLHRLKDEGLELTRLAKWAVLGFLVLLLPLLAGLGITPHVTGDAYCQVCPSRIATTLLTANPEQMAVPTGGWLDFALAALRNALFGFVVIAALAVRQPFCRICPMLALHAVFRRLSPTRLVKAKAHDKCAKCRLCSKACPMDIWEVSDRFGHKAFHEDCTLCGRCVEFCPDDGVLALKTGPLALFRSSKAYFRRRVRVDHADGSLRLRPAREAGDA